MDRFYRGRRLPALHGALRKLARAAERLSDSPVLVLEPQGQSADYQVVDSRQLCGWMVSHDRTRNCLGVWGDGAKCPKCGKQMEDYYTEVENQRRYSSIIQ
jgi:hypothetical protein